MTTVDRLDEPTWLNQARPRLRSQVRVGPALQDGPETVHLITDAATQSYFRVGQKEAFLISRLDGRSTLAEIGLAYGRRFHARLGEGNWQQLLTVLGSRHLLEPVEPAILAADRVRAGVQRRAAARGPLLWRVPWPGLADRVVPFVRWCSWLLHPLLLGPLSVLGLAVCGLVAWNWASIYAVVLGSGSTWSVGLTAVLLTWLTLVAHELSHAIACLRFGGRPVELGVMWRFPLLVPYCKVDDVLGFPRRGQQMITAFAGVYVNLLGLLVFAAFFRLGPQAGWWHALAAALLFFGTLSVLVNLIPVFQLDGYRLLEHSSSTIHLQASALRFCGHVLTRSEERHRYSRRAAFTYTGYTFLLAGIVLPVAFLVVRLWWLTLADYGGGLFATVLLLLELVLAVGLVVWGARWRGRRAATGA